MQISPYLLLLDSKKVFYFMVKFKWSKSQTWAKGVPAVHQGGFETPWRFRKPDSHSGRPKNWNRKTLSSNIHKFTLRLGFWTRHPSGAPLTSPEGVSLPISHGHGLIPGGVGPAHEIYIRVPTPSKIDLSVQDPRQNQRKLGFL